VDPQIRAQLEVRRTQEGLNSLYAELQTVDPDRAAQLHQNDGYRIQRALEVWYATGRPQSSFAVTHHGGLLHNPTFPILLLGLDRPREILRERISQRVQAMFQAGLVQEIDQLKSLGCTATTPAMRGIGYQEFFTNHQLTTIQNTIVHHTSQYAKRQMTFFRSIAPTHWVPADNLDQLLTIIHQGLPCL
jgi:tRNA dimethylallyltransferase